MSYISIFSSTLRTSNYCYIALNPTSPIAFSIYEISWKAGRGKSKQANVRDRGGKRRPHMDTHRAHIYKETQVSNIHSNIGHNIERQQQQHCIFTRIYTDAASLHLSSFPYSILFFSFFSFHSLFRRFFFFFFSFRASHRFAPIRYISVDDTLLGWPFSLARARTLLISTILKNTFPRDRFAL